MPAPRRRCRFPRGLRAQRIERAVRTRTLPLIEFRDSQRLRPQLTQHLGPIEAGTDELAHDQRDMLLRQVLRPMTGKGDLDSVAFELSVARLLAGQFAKPMIREPSFHRPPSHFSGHGPSAAPSVRTPPSFPPEPERASAGRALRSRPVGRFSRSRRKALARTGNTVIPPAFPASMLRRRPVPHLSPRHRAPSTSTRRRLQARERHRSLRADRRHR